MESKTGGKFFLKRLGTLLCLVWIAFILLLSLQTVGYEDTLSYQPYTVFVLIAVYIVSRILFKSWFINGRVFTISIVLSSLVEIGLGIWQFISGTSNHGLYPITGTFFNPGPYSAYVTIGIVISASSLITEKSKLAKYFFYTTIFFGLCVLCITGSRAAIVAAVSMLLWLYRKQLHPYRYFCVFILITTAIILFYLKQGSAIGRIIIWWISLKIFVNYPLCGAGNFSEAYGNGLHSFFSSEQHIKTYANYVDVTDYAYNDLLQMLVEHGLIGFSLFVVFLTVVVYNLRKKNLPICHGIVALLLFLLFSYPLQLFPYQLLLLLCGAWANSAGKHFAISINSRIACFALLLITCCVGFLSAYKIMAKRTVQREFYQFAGTLDSCFIRNYYEMLPDCDKNKHFLFNFATILREERRYNDSNAMLRRGMLVSNDPMFIVVMGNNFKDMGFYDEADRCYREAFLTLPNRLYPLYQRMKLQNELLNTTETTVLCRKIIAFKQKVSSPATRQMKKDAVHILDSIN